MRKRPKFGSATGVAGAVVPFAVELLSEMADLRSDKRPIDAQLVVKLRAAVLVESLQECFSVSAEITGAGISRDDLLDRYIPAVARKLGNEWNEDQISFATTTLGAARLQWLLRAFEPALPDHEIAADAPGILVLVPAGEHHTLGAVLLSSQLRRRGFYVNLMLNARAETLKVQMCCRSFQATMISISCGRDLDELRTLVSASRHAMERNAPVLIGGLITETGLDVVGLSDADHTATDVDDALLVSALETSGAMGRAN